VVSGSYSALFSDASRLHHQTASETARNEGLHWLRGCNDCGVAFLVWVGQSFSIFVRARVIQLPKHGITANNAQLHNSQNPYDAHAPFANAADKTILK
jgi:hypothetical protein